MTWSQRRAYYGRRFRTLGRNLWHLPFYPIYYPLAWLLARLGYRFIVTRPGAPRIGHQAWEPHFYLKARALDAVPKHKIIQLGSRGMVANECLRDYWGQYFRVIRNPILICPLRPLAWMAPIRCHLYPLDVSIESETGEVLTGLPAFDDIFVRYTARFGTKPLLTVTEEHADRAWPVLEALGMPRGSWFVAVHIREDGFISAHHSKLRNADILDCVEAFKIITDAGGWVVRIGNPTMKPLPNLPNVIDYVHTDAVSSWMDIFLLGACRFFLGTDSGPVNVPAVFGRPSAVIDGIPMGHGWFLSDDLFIKKLYWSISEERLLTFEEIQATEMRDFWITGDFEGANLEWVDNSPEEIRELVVEMLEHVSGGANYTGEDERLQQEWQRLLKLRWTPLSHGVQARAGRDFLRRHSDLITTMPDHNTGDGS